MRPPNQIAGSTSFKIHAGTNTGATQLFGYSSLHIMASQNNTTVQVDTDGNGTVEVTKILNLGDSMFVNSGVSRNVNLCASQIF